MKLIPFRKQDKWGYCDVDRNITIPCQYDQSFPFWNDMPIARVLKREDGFQEKNGMVDRTGKEIIPIEYDHIGNPDEGCLLEEDGTIMLEKDGKYGFINQKGKFIVSVEYDFSEALQRKAEVFKPKKVRRKAPKPRPFSDRYDIIGKFKNGIAKVKKGEKWGFINRDGEEIIPVVYDSIDDFLERLVVAEKDSQVGFINKKNQTIIPFQYEDAWGFYNGISGVMIDKKLCFIDKKAKVVKETPYNVMSSYLASGFIRVEHHGKWGLVDRKGDLLTPIEYDFFTNFGEVYEDFKDDRMLVKKDGRLGLIDSQGKLVVPTKYLNISEFREGLAVVRIPDPKFAKYQQEPFGITQSCVALFGFIDRDGNEVIPLKYRLAHSFRDGLAFVETTNMQYGYINKQGDEYFE